MTTNDKGNRKTKLGSYSKEITQILNSLLRVILHTQVLIALYYSCLAGNMHPWVPWYEISTLIWEGIQIQNPISESLHIICKLVSSHRKAHEVFFRLLRESGTKTNE